MFIIEDTINENHFREILKAYYEFFIRLYGTERFDILCSEPEYTMDPKNWVDKNDKRLQDAINAVRLVQKDDTIKVLNVYDEADELLAMARFRIQEQESEVLIPDIIFIKPIEFERQIDLYGQIIAEIEKFARENRFQTVVIEIPVYNEELKALAEEAEYRLDENQGDAHRRYATILFEKEIPRIKSEGDHGRYRISQQTMPYNK
ncbi:MAG: hypothetical protein K2M17_03275 [Bacilli bacterium]|nr:hypothetical protein [Bacilli bacterium]